ncbi:MAG TPA: hypothetical protein VJT49_31975 [Amycolatopsis sp.]|uniref:hypothetical protein n=1 Tax=Amycolatopsis sp. TaxID=37632 RepID=UPI002B487C9A|nr:hypothetical protein [Amycolatopsis sp.]HKS49650.1 hypothetical protein [Amycolatopsis sp.]
MERTVPFSLFCHSILITWYALHGHDHDDAAQRRASAPWFRSKTEPSTLDMLTKLRRQITAARFMPTTPDQPQPKKSQKSGTPGHKPPHNRKSRVTMKALAECGTHAFVAAEIDAYRVGEKTLANRLYPRLRADELLTADRNFYS